MSNSHEDSFDHIPRDVEALSRFDKESEEILRSFLGPINGSESPPIIYHYTDANGLRGILETGRLWLSDIFTLNDPSELRHGIFWAAKILKKNGPKEFARFFEDFFKSESNVNRANYFICSFSSRGNDLAQWRAYANNGRGYALGFDAKRLQMAFEKHGCDIPALPAQAPGINRKKRVPGTFPITYSDHKLAKIYTKIINLIPLPLPANRSDQANLLSTLVVRVLTASLLFKHKAYRNEKEYRFLELHGTMKPRQVILRTRLDALIRYREFDWKKRAAGSLRTIVVGPAADRQKGFQFAQDCVRMFCSSPVDISCSDIPYRAL